MAQWDRPKGMSEETYEFLIDLSFDDEEIAIIWRLIFNDVCAAYDVGIKRTGNITVQKSKKTSKKNTDTPYFDGHQWHGLDSEYWQSRPRDPFEAYEEESKKPKKKKEKDQISTSSLIKEEAKRIEKEFNTARRKSIVERSKEPEKDDEAHRKGKVKRKGAW